MRQTWEYRRGDVYLADLNPVVGAEIGGTRPVLVLQNDVGNHFAPTLIVVPMTSNIEKKPAQPTHYLLKNVCGLSRPSMVILEQLKTLDKSRIIRYMGKTTKHQMQRIDRCVGISLGSAYYRKDKVKTYEV